MLVLVEQRREGVIQNEGKKNASSEPRPESVERYSKARSRSGQSAG